jgi:hypothetical protein
MDAAGLAFRDDPGTGAAHHTPDDPTAVAGQDS